MQPDEGKTKDGEKAVASETTATSSEQP